MPVTATLPNGTELEFPDGTTDEMIQSGIQQMAAQGLISMQGLDSAAAPVGQPQTPQKKSFDWGQAIGLAPGLDLNAAIDFGKGAVAGVGRIGTGLQQRATELLPNGTVPAAYKAILSRAYPELADQFATLNDDDLIAAQSRVGQKLNAPQDASTARNIGQIIGEVVPTLAAGAGAGPVMAGLIGGAAQGAVQPTNAQTVQQSQEQAVNNMLLGGGTGAATGGVIAALPGVPGAIKSGLNRLIKPSEQGLADVLASEAPESIGALTTRPSIKLVDRFLERFPGSAGIIRDNADKVVKSIQDDLQSLGAKPVSAEEMGTAITEGAQAYKARFFDTAEKLYKRMYKNISKDEAVPVNNARQLITDIANDNQAATGVMQEIAGTSQYKMLESLLADSADGTIPYQGLEKYRSAIGAALKKPQLLTGNEEAIGKRIYGALTEDMRAVAASKGDKVLRQFDNANQFYAMGAKNIKDNLQPVIDKKYPEQVYQAVMSGSKLGGTKINTIMGSLPKEQRELLWSGTLNNLGKANPSAQNAAGDVFSMDTLVTNWNRMPETTRKALARGAPEGTLNALETVIRRASRYKSMSDYASRSGTSQQTNIGLLLLGGLYGSATGDWENVAKGAAAVGSAYGTARLMTSPSFVKWLAGATSAKGPGTIAFKLRRLRDVAKNEPELAEDISQYIANISANLETSQ